MLEITHDNILAITKGNILCEVNCQGVMGAPFTQQVRRLFPEVFKKYVALCNNVPDKELLGRVQVLPARNKNVHFILVFGQLEYGRNEDTLYLDYNNFEKSLKTVNSMFKNQTIYIPEQIGCEKTSNGDWNKVKTILESSLIDCKCYIGKHKTNNHPD